MAQATSGKVLREARERKGYDLNTVARRLRIRPDILRAIEAGDFNAMPPRGYTRNMVNAYAKLLGLNPTEIVNLYLDEAYAQQVERARGRGASSGFNMDRETRRSRSQVGVGESSSSETRSLYSIGPNERESRQFTRMLYDDGTQFSRDDYGVTRERTTRPGKSERDFSSHHSGYDSNHTSFLDSSQRDRRTVYAGETPMHYSSSRLPAFLQSRTALIVLGAAIVIIIAIIIFNVVSNGNKQAEQDASQIPVSGIADTTESSSAASAAATEVAPTSARVVYSVKQGAECYVEIYTDGNMAPETLTGPTEKTVDVTGTWTITTWSPENITVTVDGEKAELKESSEYGGMYAYTVDFPAILKQWNSTHKSGTTSSTTGSSSTTSSTGTSTGAAAGTATGAAAGAAAGAATSTGTTSSTNSDTADDGTNYDDGSASQLVTTDDGTEETVDETGEENVDETETYDEGEYTEESYDDGTGETYVEEEYVGEPVYNENGEILYYE